MNEFRHECMKLWDVGISFNCFSSIESVQGVHTEHKECVDEICFYSEDQKR
jgi:hypothetical protein